MRKAMVEKDHPQLSVRAQCRLLDVNRNRLEPKAKGIWQPRPEHEQPLELIKLAHAKDPTMGARQLQSVLKRNEHEVSRWAVGKLMNFADLRAIYCKPRTTIPAPENKKYPYLLRNLKIAHPDQVWAIDITYIPWGRGHVYLGAIIDWYTRAVLAWKVSNTMGVEFCLEALREAVEVAGKSPEILNTDQGSQFTGTEWVSAVEALGTKVSMDGKGRWVDNVIIERFWRSVKHEWVLLHEYNTLPEFEALLSDWIDRYNQWRPHTANGGKTPWEAYRGIPPKLERDEIAQKSSDEIFRLSAKASILKISQSEVLSA